MTANMTVFQGIGDTPGHIKYFLLDGLSPSTVGSGLSLGRRFVRNSMAGNGDGTMEYLGEDDN